MHIDKHPDPQMDRMIDEIAHGAVARMSPRQLGRLLYPDATPTALADVPEAVVADHLTRYTPDDLKQGQFLEVRPGRYTFIMGHETKKRQDSQKKHKSSN